MEVKGKKKSDPVPITLLLVDDDEVEVKALKRGFTRAKIPLSVFVAKDGEKALKMLRDGSVSEPRIILLDLHMPGMGGLEFLKTLREDPDLKSEIVFVWSTSRAKKDKNGAYGLHAAGFFRKDKVGKDMPGLAKMLADYWSTVELPVTVRR